MRVNYNITYTNIFSNDVNLFLRDYAASMYSVCPKVLAQHIAKRCTSFGTVLDSFCGAGRNVIQLALTCDHGKLVHTTIEQYYNSTQ
jgi:hypothetical protein